MLLTIIVRVIDEAVLNGTGTPAASPKRFSGSVNAHVIKQHVGAVCG